MAVMALGGATRASAQAGPEGAAAGWEGGTGGRARNQREPVGDWGVEPRGTLRIDPDVAARAWVFAGAIGVCVRPGTRVGDLAEDQHGFWGGGESIFFLMVF